MTLEGREPFVRIGIIGDIHAEHEALALALEFLRKEGADVILATGDIVDGVGDMNRCCELLEEAGVLAVRGNHERWFLRGGAVGLPDATPPESVSPRARAYLESLPATRWILTSAGPLLLCHGLGDNDMDGIWPDDSESVIREKSAYRKLREQHPELRWVVNGHTHQPMVRKVDGLTVVNAGTLKRGDNPCVVVLDVGNDRIQYFSGTTGSFQSGTRDASQIKER